MRSTIYFHIVSAHMIVMYECSIDYKSVNLLRAQWLSLCPFPRCKLTRGWFAGPLIRQPGLFVWGPGGQRKLHWAPCLCGTVVPPAAGASSSQILLSGGPNLLKPEVYDPCGYTAGKPRGWPASHSPAAVRKKEEKYLNRWLRATKTQLQRHSRMYSKPRACLRMGCSIFS